MHDGQRALEQGVGQIPVEGRHLGGHHEALVDDGAGRETGHVETAGLAEGFRCGPFALAARDVELALQGIAFQSAPRDETLPHRGAGRARGIAQRRLVGGDLTPAQEGQAFRGESSLDGRPADLLRSGIHGQEHDAYTVAADRGEGDTE